MTTNEALDIASTLSDSEHRLPILVHLCEGTSRVSDISSALDVPAPTVKHNLKRLEERGLVRSTGSEYESTAVGAYVCTQTDEYLQRIAVSRRLAPFLKTVDASIVDFDLLAFENAVVTAVDSTNPHAPTERLTELTAGRDDARVVTPILPRQLHDVFHDGIVDGQLHLDMVVTADLFDLIWSRFGQTYENAVANDRLVIGVYPEDLPFGLFLFEDTLALLGHDEQNIPRCLVETGAQVAMSWANDTFRRFQTDVESYVFGQDDELAA